MTRPYPEQPSIPRHKVSRDSSGLPGTIFEPERRRCGERRTYPGIDHFDLYGGLGFKAVGGLPRPMQPLGVARLAEVALARLLREGAGRELVLDAAAKAAVRLIT